MLLLRANEAMQDCPSSVSKVVPFSRPPQPPPLPHPILPGCVDLLHAALGVATEITLNCVTKMKQTEKQKASLATLAAAGDATLPEHNSAGVAFPLDAQQLHNSRRALLESSLAEEFPFNLRACVIARRAATWLACRC